MHTGLSAPTAARATAGRDTGRKATGSGTGPLGYFRLVISGYGFLSPPPFGSDVVCRREQPRVREGCGAALGSDSFAVAEPPVSSPGRWTIICHLDIKLAGAASARAARNNMPHPWWPMATSQCSLTQGSVNSARSVSPCALPEQCTPG